MQVNDMKRLIPVSGASWKDSVVCRKKYFQRRNVWGFSDLKWCNRGACWKKSEKKCEKSLQVQKKCLPLQSRYETRAPHWGPEMSSGVRNRVPEGTEYDGVDWKDWNESTRKQVPTTQKSRALISLWNWECRSRTWNIRNIQRRVWSWLRMNASGRLNTCKSRGSAG